MQSVGMCRGRVALGGRWQQLTTQGQPALMVDPQATIWPHVFLAGVQGLQIVPDQGVKGALQVSSKDILRLQ
jgi:hypothetical protein